MGVGVVNRLRRSQAVPGTVAAEVPRPRGWLAGFRWVLGMGLRFAFLVWINHSGAASLQHFSATQARARLVHDRAMLSAREPLSGVAHTAGGEGSGSVEPRMCRMIPARWRVSPSASIAASPPVRIT